MKAVIEAAFPVCTTNGCVIESDNTEILINDPVPGMCKIVTPSSVVHFTIKNPTAKTITFIAIDQCVWNEQDGKRCDFAVTDSETFAFVEIKDTNSRTSVHKKNAKQQLEQTIINFGAIDFTNIKRQAIISWKYIPTRPIASTAMQSAKVHFWDTYKVELLEGNEMRF